MKKVVVMSDNHGDYTMIDKIKSWESDADVFAHCGDSEMDIEDLRGWVAVRGNNDWTSHFNNTEIFEVDGIRFFVCHGHRLPFSNRNDFVNELLKQEHCQVLLCGHTHVPEHTLLPGAHIINPGSTTLPRRDSDKSYCVITIDNDELVVEFKTIR